MNNYLNISIFLIFLSIITSANAQKKELNPSILEGKWILDLTPHKLNDSNFASMEITKATNDALEGYFYRSGVKITEGQINITTGKIYGALVSGDGTGKYNSSFYYENDKIYGTTHSIDKDFLSVWTGIKEKEAFQPSFEFSNNTTHKIPEGQEYTFGYLEILENRSNPDSRTIKIPVYVFKSRSSNPKPDPIIYTVGGPGYSSMRAAQYMQYYKYLDDRDLILFEQRGTQFAQPNLACPEWVEAVYKSNLPENRENNTDSIFNQAVIKCRERLIDNGIDLNGYHTKEIAADIEDLRRVLNIEQYNFLSMSYSTKIAQVLLRDYPESIRSVVMDSPLPLESNYDEVSVTNLYEATNKLLDDCEKDKDCNTAFPKLKSRFLQFLEAANQNPLTINIKNPIDSTDEIFKLKGKDLIAVFSNASTSDVPSIPLEMNKLLNGDYTSIKNQLINLFQEPGNGDGKGMRLSVWCAEEFPFVNQTIVENQKNKYPELIGLSSAVFSSDVCNIWSVKEMDDIENEHVKSDVPVLLISGEYDENTPPYFAEMLLDNFRNSFHLVFKGWKHGPTTNWSNPCAMKAANDFFNKPSLKPTTDCLEEIKTPKFKIE